MKFNKANNFLCEMAFRLVANSLEEPKAYGFYNHQALYEFITGDKPFALFPEHLRSDIGGENDRFNLEEDLANAKEDVKYVLNHFAQLDYQEEVLQEIK